MITEVITVVFNNIKYTEAMLNSLYRSTDPTRFRLIVVDSGSDLETKDFLKAYKTKAENMEIITLASNEGWCKGLNAGFKALRMDSDYVVWSNNDVLYEKNWLEKMIAHFKGGVGAVGPATNFAIGRQQAIFNHGHTEEDAPFLSGFCLMFRREVINLVGDVDERFGIGGSEELDYLIRMKRDLGFKCVIARDCFIHHFGSRSLFPYLNNDTDGYNMLFTANHEILCEKWGKDTVEQSLSYPQNDLIMCVPRREEVKGRFWKDTLMMWKPPSFQIADHTNSSDVAGLRNELAKFALQNRYRKALFCDSDMEIPRDAIFRLMQINAPIAAGYFFARYDPYFPCAFRLVKDDNREDAFVSIYEPNTGVKEVDAVGMAFTLIDVDVFRKLKGPPWFKVDRFGEDVGFCYRVRKELNLKIFCDTDLIIRHTGEGKSIGPEDYKQKPSEELISKKDIPIKANGMRIEFS